VIEKINIGDSFFKEVEVTTVIDGEVEPVDISIYDDNYFAIKTSRKDSDEEAIIFKKIPKKSDKDGILIINLTPQETALLPETSLETIPYLYGFVQIGSTITGEVYEVASFKIKTRHGGIGHITQLDRSYNMGSIKEQIGLVFDAGKLCEMTSLIVDFGEEVGSIAYNGGEIRDGELELYDLGSIKDDDITPIDFGNIRGCS